MVRSLTKGLMVLAMVMIAQPAWALFDAQLLVGKRWYEMEPDGGDSFGVSSQQVGIAAHVDPIPLVPVAFGAAINHITLNPDDLDGLDVDTAQIFEAGLEVMAWLPLIPIFTPYAKLNLPVLSTYVVEGSVDVGGNDVDYVAKGDLSGINLNLGAKFGVIPLVKFLVEVGIGQQTLKFDEIELGDTEQDTDDQGANSNVFLVGVEVGL